MCEPGLTADRGGIKVRKQWNSYDSSEFDSVELLTLILTVRFSYFTSTEGGYKSDSDSVSNSDVNENQP